MKKQLHKDLKELAIAILSDEKPSIQDLKNKAQQLYEQSILLAHASETALEKPVIITEQPTATVNTEAPIDIPIQAPANFEALEDIKTVAKEIATSEIPEVTPPQQKQEQEQEQEQETFKAPELLQELEDLTQDFDLPEFDAIDPNDIPSSKTKTSLNDTLNKGFQIGLNDRLAFVNQLFGGNQEDFTRVISLLNTKENLEEAQQFITEMVKPEYNQWEGKETFEIRFLDLVERNFQD